MSKTLSMTSPIAYKVTRTISPPVPESGWLNQVTLGEFNIVTGKDTFQTQII